MTSYAIIGTGAVGGFYGSLLQKSGNDVHFLARSDFAHIKSQGLRVDSPLGSFTLEKVNVYSRPQELPRCDVALVTWKATENGHLRETLPLVLKPGGKVLVLQNGLDPEREAAEASPDAKVISALCFLASRKAGPGWIQHLAYGAVTFAAYSPKGNLGVTPEMTLVGDAFIAAGVEVRLQDDWRLARWRKLVWNVPFNGLCALLGTDTARLLQDEERRVQVEALMNEVIAGAALCGSALPADFGKRMISDTLAMAPYEPSMKLDRDFGRPMELEAIYARPLEAITQAGGTAPQMEALLGQLKLVEGEG